MMRRSTAHPEKTRHDGLLVSLIAAYLVFLRATAAVLQLATRPLFRWIDAAADRCAAPTRELRLDCPPRCKLEALSLAVAFLAAMSYLFLDVRAARAARAFADRHPDLAAFMADLAHGNVIYTLAGLVLLTAVLRKRKRLAYYAGLALCAILASGLGVNILKFIFGRYRPKALIEDHLFGFTWFKAGYLYNSFPSGHAANAFALATALCLAWPRLTPLWGVLGILGASGRVIAVSHYPSDVLIGGLLAVLVTLLLHRLLKVRLPRLVPWLREPA